MSAKKLKAILNKFIQLEKSISKLQNLAVEMENNATQLTKIDNN
jgi:hypothetical protein